MANLNGVSQIRHNGSDINLMKLNGTILYQKGEVVPEEPQEYCIEYTVESASVALNTVYNTQYGRGLPRIYSTTSKYTFDGYEKIEITLNDGTTTTDTSTLCSNIAKVKIWYPETTKSIKFYGFHGSANRPLIKTVDYCNTLNFTNMEYMFYYCDKLTSVECADWDTSNVTSMGDVFRESSALVKADVSKWNTDLVTDVGSVFDGCKKLTSIDVSKWNTSNATQMRWTFSDCSGITELDLSNWKTNLVTDMYGMFDGCSNLISLDIRNWSTEKVTDTDYMFSDCDKLYILRLDNCSNDTINDIITSYDFPIDAITGVTRTIYCKEANAAGLTAPTNWVFEYVD